MHLKDLLILLSLSTLLFYLTIYRLVSLDVETVAGLRGLFFFAINHLTDLSLYTVKGEIIYWFDSGLGCYLLPYLLVKLVSWPMITSFSIFFLLILSLINVLLLFSFFNKNKYASVIIPLVYFLFPSFKFPNVLLITFFLLAFKYKHKPYLSAFLASISAFFFKQYMIVPNILLLFFPFKFNRKYFYKLLIFFGLPLIIYSFFPNSLNAMFLSVLHHGFAFDGYFALLFFSSILIVIVIFVNFWKKPDYDLLLVIFSILFLLISQYKIGSTYYLGFFSVLFLIAFFKFKTVDKIFMLIGAFFFFLFFMFSNLAIFIPSAIHITALLHKPFQSIFVNNSILLQSMKTFHPLFLSKEQFSNVILLNNSVNPYDFNLIILNRHEPKIPFFIKQNCFYVPLFWDSCINCRQLELFCFKDKRIALTYFNALFNYYQSHSTDICFSSKFVYDSMMNLGFFRQPCLHENQLDINLLIFHQLYAELIKKLAIILPLIMLILYFFIKVKHE